jgi:hypothetical protein
VDAKRIVPTFFTSFSLYYALSAALPNVRAVSRGHAADANEDSVSRR